MRRQHRIHRRRRRQEKLSLQIDEVSQVQSDRNECAVQQTTERVRIVETIDQRLRAAEQRKRQEIRQRIGETRQLQWRDDVSRGQVEQHLLRFLLVLILRALQLRIGLLGQR